MIIRVANNLTMMMNTMICLMICYYLFHCDDHGDICSFMFRFIFEDLMYAYIYHKLNNSFTIVANNFFLCLSFILSVFLSLSV